MMKTVGEQNDPLSHLSIKVIKIFYINDQILSQNLTFLIAIIKPDWFLFLIKTIQIILLCANHKTVVFLLKIII